jgi:hypothetical protein
VTSWRFTKWLSPHKVVPESRPAIGSHCGSGDSNRCRLPWGEAYSSLDQ